MLFFPHTPFLKNRTLSCENYRPISLISAGYKFFVLALLNRLKDAGTESRLSSTQSGFHSQRGSSSSDAIFSARRLSEDASSRREGSLIFMALDLAKAFDFDQSDKSRDRPGAVWCTAELHKDCYAHLQRQKIYSSGLWVYVKQT